MGVSNRRTMELWGWEGVRKEKGMALAFNSYQLDPREMESQGVRR